MSAQATQGSSCPLCGGAGRPAISRPPRRYDRCASCGSLWLVPAPTDAELMVFYDDGSFYRAAEGAEVRQRGLARRRLQTLAAAGERGRLLDVGCAAGLFIEEAIQAGWSATGMEPSTMLAEKARAKGLNVARGPSLHDVPVFGLDAVTAWEVLEHVREPSSFLADVAARLRPGGVIGLSTPDAASLASRALGASYPFASSPEHLVLFSRLALRQLIAKAGLRVVRERAFSGMGLSEAGQMLDRRLGSWARLGAPAVSFGFTLLDGLQQGTEVEVYAIKER